MTEEISLSKVLTTHPVLGFPVQVPAPGSPDQPATSPYLAWLQARQAAGQGTHVVTFNAEMAMLGRQDTQFADLLHTTDALTPDGAGVVLALRRLGLRVPRCPGIELAEALFPQAAAQGWQVAMIGGQPEVNAAACAHWQARYPTLNLWGHHGYFLNQPAEAAVLAHLQASQPQVILVGLGAPRQEYWIRAHRSLVPQGIWMGIGGSVDIWAGTKERAPRWWRDHHLEWLYRLYQEPWRWRRMLALPHFAWTVLWHR